MTENKIKGKKLVEHTVKWFDNTSKIVIRRGGLK